MSYYWKHRPLEELLIDPHALRHDENKTIEAVNKVNDIAGFEDIVMDEFGRYRYLYTPFGGGPAQPVSAAINRAQSQPPSTAINLANTMLRC